MSTGNVVVSQDAPAKNNLWIQPKGTARFWNGSFWKTISGSGGSGGPTNLSDLDDISLSSLTNGQILKYNSTTQKWENTNVGDLSNYYTKAEANTNFLSKNFFKKLFQAHYGSSDVNPENPSADSSIVVDSIEAMFGFWTEQYISALGQNSSGGGGGGGDLDWESLVAWDEDPEHIININYLPISLNNGVITIGNNSITPLTSHQDISGKANKTITITGTNGLSGGGTLEQNRTIGIDSTYKSKIDNVLSMFELDSNGDIKTKDKPNNGGHRGFYSESFISALGANSSGGGGGGGGISETDLWIELTDNSGWLTTDPKIIARNHLPINGTAANSGGQTFYAPTSGGSNGQYLRWPSSGSIPYWDTLDASDIPNLSASKINSGTFDAARIPTLSITDKTSGTLPITRGGTGRTTTASGAWYNTAANQTSPTIGTLPIAQGGTGQTSQANINKAFIGALGNGISDVTDGTEFVSSYASDNGFSDSNAVNVAYRRSFLKVWNYVKGKMSSDSAINISGNAATATIATKLGTSNVGSSTNPIYLSSGTATACTYSLSSTVNAGTANYLAYYNSSNQIDDSSISCDGTNITMPTSSLITSGYNASHKGIKLGNTYLNAISGDVIFQNNDAIRFGADDWDYNKWAGLKYDSTNKIIYLGLADRTVFIANNAQSGGTLALPGIRYFSVNGKRVIDAGDSWLRINENNAYSSGIYFGSGVVRTDGTLQVGNGGASFQCTNGGNTTVGGYLGLTQTTGAGIGISLYGSLPSSGAPTYGMMFAKTDSYGEFGDVKKISGSSYTWATYFTMGTFSTDVNRGWIFRNVTSGNNVASISTNGNFCASGGVTALATSSSDKRLKKEIKPFNATEIIDKLNPVEFEWNKKANKYNSNLELNKKNYGLIAQDSDGIIDDLVFDLPDGKGYKGVRYEKLIPILLQAVKEQQKEIDELKQIIKKLKV